VSISNICPIVALRHGISTTPCLRKEAQALISIPSRRAGIALSLIVAVAAVTAMGCGGGSSNNGNGSSSSSSNQTSSQTSGPMSIPQAADLYTQIALKDEPGKTWSTSSTCTDWRNTAGAYNGEAEASQAFIAGMQQLVRQDPEFAPFKDIVNRGITGQLYGELLSRCGIG
jgi:hypothetical protein